MKIQFFKLLFIFFLFKNNKNENQITLIISGKDSKFIYNSYNPYKILLNGIDLGANTKYKGGLDDKQNYNITIIWKELLTKTSYMFFEVYNVIHFDFSKFNTSKITNMDYMFCNCYLESLNIYNLNTSSVKSMNYMFYYCQYLKSLTIENFNTSQVNDMEAMFADCHNLISLNINKLDTSKIESMINLFSDCRSLEYIDMNFFNCSNVKTMYHIFYQCYSLKSINLNNIDTSKVNDMTGMFERCYNLTSIDLSNFNTSSAVSMLAMFNECKSLTTLNLSNFDTSSVTNMNFMLQKCEKIIYLDLSNFDTSKVENMDTMFKGCIGLKSLNLINFNTKSLKEIAGMFQDCHSLKELNISNFDTSLITRMSFMFSGCYNLTTINLNNFNTENVVLMDNMFENCYSLISLNLSNFRTSKVKNMTNMFKGCSNLKLLDLNNLDFSKVIYYRNIFEEINKNLTYCNNKDPNSLIIQLLNEYNNICSCNLNPEKIIVQNFACIFDCYKDKENDAIYIYNERCYQNCPIRTKISASNNYLCEYLNCENNNIYYNFNQTECIDDIPNRYYVNDTNIFTIDICSIECSNCSLESNYYNLCISCNTDNNYYPKLNDSLNINSFIKCYNKTPENYILENNIYKPCYNSCKNCSGYGNEKDNKCISCKPGFNFIEYENDTNCYENCTYYYYFDSDKKYHCTQVDACPKEVNKLIIEKRKCIDECSNDKIYKYEYNNTCYEQCPNNTFNFSDDKYLCLDEDYLINTINVNNSENNQSISKECHIKDYFIGVCKLDNYSQFNASMLDKMINDIKAEIKNGSLDELIINLLEGDKKDLKIEGNNIIYQLTSTENQHNNENIKNINISTINLDECEKILKRENNINQNQSLLIFKIDYFQEGSSIPIIGYEIYNPLDLRKELNLDCCKNINISIPASINEDKLYKYDPKNEYYTDECFPSTTENGTDILLNDRQNEFNNKNLSLCEKKCTYYGYNIEIKKANCECEIKYDQLVISDIYNQKDLMSYEFDSKNDMLTMKCYKTLFSKNGLIRNIGSYVLLFIILLFLISIILFYKCGYISLEDKIKVIYNSKIRNKKEKNIEIKETIDVKDNKNKKNKKKKKGKNKTIKNLNIKKNKKKKSEEKNNKKRKKNINPLQLNSYNDSKSGSKIEIKINKFIVLNNNEKNKKNNKNQKSKEKNKKNINNYDDFELNSFSYENAILYDKRAGCTYYFSLIKYKHPIIFYLCILNDYNSIIIKMDLFCLSLSFYYFINTLFFDESTIHKIYEDEGIYNFIYLAPFISYSFIISHTLSLIVKYVFLSERNLYEIKKEKNIEKVEDKMGKAKKRIIIKYITFFSLGLIFLLFFWYYLSSFGAVYQNTQVYIIINTSICLGISILYPFIINILPAIFRICSLSNKKRRCIYKISKILQFI